MDADVVARLLEAARARLTAGSVGCAGAAAVSDDADRVYAAATVLAEAPGTSACALRLALARARAEGAGPIRAALALWPVPGGELCGLCRQSVLELAPGAELLLAGEGEEARLATPAALLPRPFLRFRPET